MIKKCACCGTEFEPRNNAVKFCSSKCRIQKHKELHKLSVLRSFNISKYTCKQCGKEFKSKVKKDFCCAGCENNYAANRKERNRQNALELARINQIARDEGLSYGEYFKKYGYGDNK